MERFEVHYWNEDGEPRVATMDGEDDGGHEVVARIEDLDRLGYVKSLGPVEESDAPLVNESEQDKPTIDTAPDEDTPGPRF